LVNFFLSVDLTVIVDEHWTVVSATVAMPPGGRRCSEFIALPECAKFSALVWITPREDNLD